MTSKQRAYLKGLAMTMDPIFQIGKSSLTPENTAAIAEALEARELIKISVLQNCMDDPNDRLWQNAPVHRSYRSSGKRLFCIKREKKAKRKLNFQRLQRSRHRSEKYA